MKSREVIKVCGAIGVETMSRVAQHLSRRGVVGHQRMQGLPSAFQQNRIAVSGQDPDRTVAVPLFQRPDTNELLRLIGHL